MDGLGDALQLDGDAIRVPQCSTHRLIVDDRAFDAEVIRSAVVFYNLMFAGAPLPREGRKAAPEVLAQAFGWVPEVVARRAERAGVPVSNVAWRQSTDQELLNAGAAVLTLAGPLRVLARAFRYRAGSRTFTFAEWVDHSLGMLPIYSRYRFRRSKVQLTSVPLLAGVPQCVAYAVAAILLDRWDVGFGSRIRECPYVRPLRDADDRPVPQTSHCFLDFRIGRGGEMEKNRQRFCCPEHGNRFKQQRHRERLAQA